MNKSKILFLCTGNYYRSRFAEEYFNHRAGQLQLDWIADSRGLADTLDPGAFPTNFGPISIHALTHLQLYQVTARNIYRYPECAMEDDFHNHDCVIAVCRREHEPMIQAKFPDNVSSVDYLDIDDIDVEDPATAIPKLVHGVDRLLQRLR